MDWGMVVRRLSKAGNESMKMVKMTTKEAL